MASIFVILKRACFISAAAGNVLEVLFPQNFLEFYFQLFYEPWFCLRQDAVCIYWSSELGATEIRF